MEVLKFAGLIECGDSIINRVDTHNEFDGFRLKKILIRDKSENHMAREYYPHAEMVQDTRSIIHDDSIELVIVSAPGESDLNLVAEAIGAGKQVRVL